MPAYTVKHFCRVLYVHTVTADDPETAANNVLAGTITPNESGATITKHLSDEALEVFATDDTTDNRDNALIDWDLE